MQNSTVISFLLVFCFPVACFADTQEKSPYTLSKCIDTAVDHNYDIARARERLERAGALRLTAAASLLPSVQGSANYLEMDTGLIPTIDAQTFGSDRMWAAGVELTQKIFAGGKYWGAFRAQQKQEQAAVHELQEVINNTLLDVRARYYAVLLAKARVTVQEQSIALLTKELENERKKNAAGTVSDFNVLRAEVAVANGQPNLIRARNTLVVSREELRQVLGLPGVEAISERGVHSHIEVEGDLKYEPVTFNLDSLLKDSIRNRPEILRLEKVVEASKHEVSAAYAGHAPDIEAFGSYGIEKNNFSDDIRDDLKGWRAGVRARWNIFDSLGTVGKIQAASATRNDAALALEQQRISVEVEVRRAFSTYVEARNLVLASQQVVRQAEESFRLARSRADAGAATQLDVLDAEVALTDARTNEILALHDYAIAVATLKRAAGILEVPSERDRN